ncbi:hypothetical protein P9302_22490 [Brevibacillus agri]|uniref:hypothetical protein n=1 Tax=Brevibacillus agri TaxID=51101 RepID=UPI002E1CBFDA|nr:hypothetical protein [Brevibacillus agri]
MIEFAKHTKSTRTKSYWQLAVVIALFFSWFIVWENAKERHHFASDELVYTKSIFSDVMYKIEYERDQTGNAVAYHTTTFGSG